MVEFLLLQRALGKLSDEALSGLADRCGLLTPGEKQRLLSGLET